MNQGNKRKFYYGYIVVAFACLILVVTQGAYFSFGIFFKPVSSDFGWTRAMTSGAFSLCTILHGFLAVFTGRLTDWIGPRFVITAGALFLGLGYVLMSQTAALWQLYLFYGILVAMGISTGFIPMVSTVPRWFVKRRGLMTGVVASGTALGTLVVPPLANFLIATYDWRISYTIIGIATLVIILPAAQFLRRDPGQVGQLPDGKKEVVAENSNLQREGLSLSEAVRTGRFWLFFTMQFCFGFCLFVIMVHITPHATDLGIPAIKAANILAIIGGGGVAGRLLMGAIGDRIGHKQAYAVGFGVMLITLVFVTMVKEVELFYLFAAVFGFAYGGMSALLSPIAADLFGLRYLSTIVGTAGAAWTMGGALSPFVAGYIFDVTGSYRLAFLLNIMICALGLVVASLLGVRTAARLKDAGR